MKCKNNQFRYIYINQYFQTNSLTKTEWVVINGRETRKDVIKKMNNKRDIWINAGNRFFDTKSKAMNARKSFQIVDILNNIYIPSELLTTRTIKIPIKII